MGGIKPTSRAYLRRPEWLQKRGGLTAGTAKVRALLSDARLATVCQSARCPNRGECFNSGVATFMILGESCSRHCGFCAVTTGGPEPVDADEPRRVAAAAAQLGLGHVVITSVTRDDLDDGGASHFAATITAIRNKIPQSAVEVLTPDFAGNRDAIATVTAAKPDVYNHNVETVPALYATVRPGADYPRSLDLLATVKQLDRSIATKSGIMVGFGETTEQIVATLSDLRNAAVDMVTIGQYLQPTRHNLPVTEYVTPERFRKLREIALQLGFAKVEAGPYVRSSYHAAELFEQQDSSPSID